MKNEMGQCTHFLNNIPCEPQNINIQKYLSEHEAKNIYCKTTIMKITFYIYV